MEKRREARRQEKRAAIIASGGPERSKTSLQSGEFQDLRNGHAHERWQARNTGSAGGRDQQKIVRCLDPSGSTISETLISPTLPVES